MKKTRTKISFYTITTLLFLSLSQVLAGTVNISWDAVTKDINGQSETGTIYYQIYGQTFPGFSITSENFIGSTTSTSYTYSNSRLDDPNIDFFFRIFATDEWGNSSDITPVAGTSMFVLAKINVFLEGPYDATGDTMRTALQQANLIHRTSPYSSAISIAPLIPTGTVDWIYVALRKEATGPIVAQKSLFLRKDGSIVEEDGETETIGLTGIENDDYFVIINHRNHISVMSKAAFSLNNTTPTFVDFTTTNTFYYGGEAKQIETTEPFKYGMFAGDPSGSETITTLDYFAIKPRIGRVDYTNADCNLGGSVVTLDYFNVKFNMGRATQVP